MAVALADSNFEDFAASSGTADYPATTIATDDLCVIFCASDDDGAAFGFGTSDFADNIQVNEQNGGVSGAVAWHKAVGGEESDTFTLSVSNGGEKFIYRILHITGWEDTVNPTFSTVSSGTSTTPNTNSASATHSGEENYFISAIMINNSPTISVFPTNFGTDNFSQATSPGGDARLGMASRLVTADSQDPDDFTISASNDWMGVTMCIQPTGAGGGAVGLIEKPLLRSFALVRSWNY